ncbi:S8 family peptidase [Sediminibacterium sp.]|uniref:S8 family peptidase n=1 Tax=Sediminibacterium sp. TaxID=1917865 RepID=UPI0025FA6E87|nr:S8 family peptidase [Sediminibacterium sp.]MBW0176968.1 S8 family peptidase [Sediminibacterium sp.]
MHKRLLLFCWVFALFYAGAQDKIPPHFSYFVEGSYTDKPLFNQQKTAFLFLGKIPASIKIVRRLADTIAIVQVPDYSTFDFLTTTGRLFNANNRWKLAENFIVPVSEKEKEKIQSWILEPENAKTFNQFLGIHPFIQIEKIADNNKAVQVKTSWKYIEQYILSRSDLLFIDRVRQAFTERELTGFDLSANKGNLAHRTWPNINGNGITISIKENKPDTADVDMAGRYLSSNLSSPRVETHATTMATIAAGAGNSFYTGKGFAYGASITSSDFSNLLPDALSELMRLGVTVQNHSYGTGIENYYGADAAAYDDQMHTANLNLLHIFSAGNLGTQTPVSGTYAGINGFANLTGSFKMSKNSIAVGAADSFGIVPLLSSRGPAYDGRLKPELVALGEDGSSGAAAIVSGMAALLQQTWKQKYTVLPLSSAIRAVLFNSADDVGIPHIDYRSGYGMANAYRAVQTIQDNRVVQDYVRDQQQWTHRIQVPPGAKNLKITLNWTDAPAKTNSYKAIVNDLDLVLEHLPSAQQWQPWVLSSFPHADSLNKPAVRKKDTLNTNEQIVVEQPAPGTYEVKVNAFSIQTGGQDFAIAWQYDTTADFLFSYPVKGDQMDPDRKNTIRWESNITDTATLEYRLNSGNWSTVSNAVDVTKKYFQWQPPDTLATIQFRLKTTQNVWVSDTAVISRNLQIYTGFNCADSFLLYWQKARVDSYRVYRLGQKYLEPLVSLADTSLIQFKQNNSFRVFTVAALLPGNIEGKRAYAFDYTNQQIGCYLKGFIADPVGTNSARLNLQLGTTYQVSKIVFEKLTKNGYAAVQEITPVTANQFTITTAANKGLNIYRARVQLNNGASYYTQPEQVIHFVGQPYYVFPNPVQPGSSIQVLTEDPDNKIFRLYDLFGRLLMKAVLTGTRNQLAMPLLQKGIYFYTITQTNQREISGKLVVE